MSYRVSRNKFPASLADEEFTQKALDDTSTAISHQPYAREADGALRDQGLTKILRDPRPMSALKTK
jgi:hypothetical protein